MGFATALNGTLRTFIARQKLFFVATAAEGGRVNVSPKGGRQPARRQRPAAALAEPVG